MLFRSNWNMQVHSLTIFRHVLDDDVFSKFLLLCDSMQEDLSTKLDRYCTFVSSLYQNDTDFSAYLYRWLMNDENTVIHRISRKESLPQALQDSLHAELEILEEISSITSDQMIEWMHYDGFLPKWETSHFDFEKDYFAHLHALPKEGYGVFAKYRAFGIQHGRLVPIIHPDPQRLSDLIGYKREREQVIKNSLAFLEGIKVNNVLLYGDAGTGKSSTVKAIVNEYYKEGLRLIEVKKDQLAVLPEIMDSLADNPLHFIIFIDDLSFKSNDDDFVALKNILEGGIQNNQNNCVVYATSNRRHFVQENSKNRDGGELFRNDSIQETMSLAARFGLTVTFTKPLKDLYLEIVMQLADRYQIETDRDVLAIQAEAYAIRNSGRSPRTAKQFIEYTKINEKIK